MPRECPRKVFKLAGVAPTKVTLRIYNGSLGRALHSWSHAPIREEGKILQSSTFMEPSLRSQRLLRWLIYRPSTREPNPFLKFPRLQFIIWSFIFNDSKVYVTWIFVRNTVVKVGFWIWYVFWGKMTILVDYVLEICENFELWYLDQFCRKVSETCI